MAGLALILVSICLVKVKKPSVFALIPALFVIITCEAALLYEGTTFLHATGIYILQGPQYSPKGVLLIPIAKVTLTNYLDLAAVLNCIFGIIGIILFILGLVVAYDAAKALGKARRGE